MNEKMKILIAYDGSDCSKEAIKDLNRAGLPRETEALAEAAHAKGRLRG